MSKQIDHKKTELANDLAQLDISTDDSDQHVADQANLSTPAAEAAYTRNIRNSNSVSTSSRAKQQRSLATYNQHIGMKTSHIQPTEDIFNSSDPRIKEDIIAMVMQYLQEEGYYASHSVLYDETNVKWKEREERTLEIKRLKKAILDGDWSEVEKLCNKPLVKNHRAFLYSVYKQQYLEYLEKREIQKAFTFLNKRLKPLEHFQTKPNEFKDMCYLLTAKSIHEAPSFKQWEGIMASREALVDQLQSMLEFETADRTNQQHSRHIPPDRLLTLLRQAVAYQIEFSRYHPKIAPTVSTLLEDYTSFVIPNAVGATLTGHKGNIKCLQFLGVEGKQVVSGSSDNTLRIWDTETAECIDILKEHRSRVWDLSTTVQGEFIASASGDSTVKIWNLKNTAAASNAMSTEMGLTGGSAPLHHHQKANCCMTLTGHAGDVYSVQYHPSESQIFNPLGNLVISG
ncbi:hypothetical protein BDF20DRAFT_868118 [Mycotypha africana]|uniref:uncharacterized protein n=1 Tax=Mycotypha africana TaxID=64632 RepID=UPI002301FA85|nr:uncharacterized protein BDF20DRAFT_868118 [Mycotypha africana]KAI8979195.1 hypothetical protein BDF20DRAFT_868118 [Mycotypha africana]